MIILAIETSCDETSVAVLENQKVLSNITISQIWEQQKYGGVVPDLAAKLHLENIQKVLKRALSAARIEQEKIDYIAYTEKPGLVICLQIGKVIAETLALYLDKPLIPCNHLEGHVYASLLETTEEWQFPALALVISGGHTQLYYLKKHLDFELLGQTLDDAVGECLDKVSLLLGHTYPGGPIIEKLALTGKNTYPLPLTKLDNTFAFSFSGLKTAVRRIIEREKSENSLTKLNINNLAYSLQYTLAKILTFKVEKALHEKKINTLVLGGGVIANKYLADYFQRFLQNKSVKLFLPQKKYCTDNAAMIGILAYYQVKFKTNTYAKIVRKK
ncbi:MAG: O-sialoglycoprotein endopeptidase [Mycoplasmataceae bacterium CE_OT135]|nr:MAG: O-sialoglycoprotein endopeptidase [Mycoplasmataceae bacterium CE_OT135]